jgi:hypothetical protein
LEFFGLNIVKIEAQAQMHKNMFVDSVWPLVDHRTHEAELRGMRISGSFTSVQVLPSFFY